MIFWGKIAARKKVKTLMAGKALTFGECKTGMTVPTAAMFFEPRDEF